MVEKRDHFIVIIYNSFSSFVKAFLPFALIIFSKPSQGNGFFSSLIFKWVLILLVFVIIVVYNIFKWFRQTYYFKDNFIVVKQGVLVVQRKEIPFNKVQTIDIAQAVKYRIFSLAQIKIDTGNSSINSVELSFVMGKHEAEDLKDYILSYEKQDTKDEFHNIEDIIKVKVKEEKITTKELNLSAITTNNFFAGIIFIMSLYAIVDNYLEAIFKDKIQGAESKLEQIDFSTISVSSLILWIILIISVYILFSFIVSLIKNYITYYDFTVKREKENIIIRYGFLEKKNYIMPVEKISAIYIKQNLLRQIFNMRTLHVETVGYGNEKGEAAILYPLAKGSRYKEIIENILPEFVYDKPINRVPKRSLKRFFFKGIIISLVVIIVTTVKFKYGYFSVIILPIAVLRAWLEYKNAGYSLSEDLLCLSSHGFLKVVAIIPKDKIQSIKFSCNYFQRRKELFNYHSSIQGNVFGTEIRVNNLGYENIEELQAYIDSSFL